MVARGILYFDIGRISFFQKKLSLQKYERSETTMLDRWSITVSDIDPDPIRRAASSDGLEVKAAVTIIQKSYK